MIYFVSTASHRYTHQAVVQTRPGFRRFPYPLLFTRRSLPRGTYIFTDFDRLGFWQLELAAHIYRVLERAGCRVLNDPARALQRLSLLRALHREEINSFQAWPATDLPEVDRFPVFIRTASAHRGNLTGLIGGAADLEAALNALIDQGYPIADLIIVEYRASPIRGDVFRKLSMYRVGDALVPVPSVHERNWTAKNGEHGAAGEEGYAEDLVLLKERPHAATIRRVFDIARIRYGRTDFGIVGGRPEIYEINTNPMMSMLFDHPSPLRAEALRISVEQYLAALDAIDTPADGGRIPIDPPAPLQGRGKSKRLLPGYRWLP